MLALSLLFSAADNSASFKLKQNLTDKSAVGGTKNVEIMVSLKYLNNFWRTLEMPLINCEINLINCEINIISTWSNNICNN